jgi:glucosamine-6-phosphate deaminase
MNENLFDHINIKKENTRVPDGMAKDLEAECLQYEEEIRKAGSIDIQVLGIGSDGHIAFNEPGSSLGSRTRIKTLTKQTIEDNSRFFEKEEDVPKFALTMGIGSIMETRNALLFANGEKKADVIAAAIEGPITADITASILQMHPRVIYLLDEAAALKLKRKDYYKWVDENRAKVKGATT